MVGSVAEWVTDWHDDDYHERSPSQNPQGSSKGILAPRKVLRGGADGYGPEIRRCAFCGWLAPNSNISYLRNGFRLVIALGRPED
jgi:formylglycine-generating enzyme required for sulfatase activity